MHYFRLSNDVFSCAVLHFLFKRWICCFHDIYFYQCFSALSYQFYCSLYQFSNLFYNYFLLIDTYSVPSCVKSLSVLSSDNCCHNEANHCHYYGDAGSPGSCVCVCGFTYRLGYCWTCYLLLAVMKVYSILTSNSQWWHFFFLFKWSL